MVQSIIDLHPIKKAMLSSKVEGMATPTPESRQLSQNSHLEAVPSAAASLAEAVRSAVKANHSYTTPAILVVAIESGDADYLGWLLAETKPAP